MRNNELKHHRFYKGLFVRHGLFSFTSLFKRLSTSKRIHLGIAITALLACLQLFIFADRIVETVGLALLFIALAVYLHAQIAKPVKSIVQQMQRVVSGRKADYYHFDRVDEIGLMMRMVNQSGLNLHSLVDDVGAQISGISTISQQVAKEGMALQTRTEETADFLQQTASAVEEIASAVQQTAETAKDAILMADRTPHQRSPR